MELKFLDQQDPTPSHNSHALPHWLAEIREMRGRVFYDNGRRPHFRMDDGSFGDPDPADTEAYHIIARSQGRAVGCARIVPPASLHSGFVASTIGRQRFKAILRELGISRERTCEVSRWVVVPEFRGGLGREIVAASWAVARWLSFQTVSFARTRRCACAGKTAAKDRGEIHRCLPSLWPRCHHRTSRTFEPDKY